MQKLDKYVSVLSKNLGHGGCTSEIVRRKKNIPFYKIIYF